MELADALRLAEVRRNYTGHPDSDAIVVLADALEQIRQRCTAAANDPINYDFVARNLAQDVLELIEGA